MSFFKQTYFFRGYVKIETVLSLYDAATSISKHLLGGIEFGGREMRIRDELDAIYAETFGIRFILVEQPDGLVLELHSIHKLKGAKEIDLSESVVAMLEEWREGKVELLE